MVCGTRDFADPFRWSLLIDARIGELPAGCTVLHGTARGADIIAAEAAERRGHTVVPFPPDENRPSPQRFHERNDRMLNDGPDLVLAFWDGKSRGTWSVIDKATRRGIPVEVRVKPAYICPCCSLPVFIAVKHKCQRGTK
jgi:hypothetical protein